MDSTLKEAGGLPGAAGVFRRIRSLLRRGVILWLLSLAAAPLIASVVPPGFSEAVLPGPGGGDWNAAVGMAVQSNGRLYVWERGGRVWFKDPADSTFSLL